MMKILLLIALGGGLGTGFRFVAMRYLNHRFPGFPYGTLLVNVLGSFLAGLIYMEARQQFIGDDTFLPLILVGFIGAFTTFSTYALESMRMLMHGKFAKGFLNITVMNVTGLVAVYAGVALGGHWCW
ncbi:MAG: fluoride efflux transporter CrcB [Victivallaceae bacterium]